MGVRASKLFALCVGSVIVANSDCTESTCYDLVPGTKIAITVVEQYDQSSHFLLVEPFTDVAAGVNPSQDCGFGFDITQGQTLEGTVAYTGGNLACKDGALSIAPFGNWSWTLKPGTDLGGTSYRPLAGSYDAHDATCIGHTDLTLYSLTSNDIFQASVPGHIPNVVMTRAFYSYVPPNSPQDCGACVGTFVVNLTRM